MIDWTISAYCFLCGAMVVMMAIGLIVSAVIPTLDRWSRGYFIALFSDLLIYSVVLTVDILIFYNYDIAAWQRIFYVFEYSLFSLLTILPVPFILHRCGETLKDSVVFCAVIMLWCLFCVFLSATQFTDMFYYVSPDNEYFRGPLFPLMISPLAAVMILNVVCLIRRRKKLSKRVFSALLIYSFPTTILIILYMFAAVDTLVSFWMTLCAMTMFGLIIMDNIKQYTQQQQKIAHQHAGIMVLQMRPHFICNTMMGIYYLCDQDVQKAKQVTLDFTTYLRKNFAAIANENNIPFAEELEHTRAYLAVEQAQFEDTLFVNFDTEYSEFCLPPLTLQPIVENAVKHGLVASSNQIHISVITRKTDTGSEIIVEDDGPGFKPVDDNEPHIALKNIKERLGMMCNGELEITTRKAGGTSVRVTIPASGKRPL